MKIITQQYFSNQIIYSELSELPKFLSDKVNIIITEKTIYHLYPHLFDPDNTALVLNISEKEKNIEKAQEIWKFFIQNNITKEHHIVIIGGGVLHDITLFACSVFKRGLKTISVPTTLLSMIDASIGGKNAINFQGIKNIIGTIYLPYQNIIVKDFLDTLNHEQLLSGWAEIIKIALVKDKNFYYQCIDFIQENIIPNSSIIQKSIQLKSDVITKDIADNNHRQLLNYGHTIGHAIEAWYNEKQQYIPHGYAIAQGMIIENIIAEKLKILPQNISRDINQTIKRIYPSQIINNINAKEISLLLQKIQQDKKNAIHSIHFTLIEDIGQGKTKVPVDIKTIQETLETLSH